MCFERKLVGLLLLERENKSALAIELSFTQLSYILLILYSSIKHKSFSTTSGSIILVSELADPMKCVDDGSNKNQREDGDV